MMDVTFCDFWESTKRRSLPRNLTGGTHEPDSHPHHRTHTRRGGWAAGPGQTPGAHDAHAAHVASDELEGGNAVDHRAEIERRFVQGNRAEARHHPRRTPDR